MLLQQHSKTTKDVTEHSNERNNSPSIALLKGSPFPIFEADEDDI